MATVFGENERGLFIQKFLHAALMLTLRLLNFPMALRSAQTILVLILRSSPMISQLET